MAEIKYVIEVEDNNVDKVFDDIADKAVQAGKAIADGTKSMDGMADVYAKASENATALTDANQKLIQSTGNIQSANETISNSFKQVGDNAKGYLFTNEQLLNQSKQYTGVADNVAGANKSVSESQSSVAKGNEEVASSYDEVAKKAQIVEALQRDILKGVGSEYKNSMGAVLNSYEGLSAPLQNAYQRVVNLEQATVKLNEKQANLNKSLKDGSLSQEGYVKAVSALRVQQENNNKSVTEAKARIDQLRESERASIGSISEMTAKLTQLKRQYDNLSEAQRKNADIGGKIASEYNKVSAEVEKAGKSMQGSNKSIGSMLGSLRNMAGAVGIAFGVQQVVSFGLEIFEVTKKLEGVSLAYARLGAGEQGLQRLRKATQDTVDDLKLMTLAVEANNFKIPLDVLAKGLEFATRRAQDTGKSVDYLVDSFVTGLGRKSTMVLDNLGLSIIDIQEEVKKVGDFNIAVGNIIEREMERSGVAVDGLGSKVSRLSTIWQNAKIAIAGWVAEISGELSATNIDKYIQESTDRVKGFDKAVTESRQATIKDREIQIQSIQAQIKASEELRKQMAKPGYRRQADETLEKQLQLEKTLKERLYAENAVLSKLNDQNKALATQERISKGIVSDAELEEQIAEKRKLANQWVVKDNTDLAQKNKLIKEADELQKKLDERSGKASNEASKKALRDQERLNRQIEQDGEKRIALLNKWADADTSFLNKTMSDNEQEIESVKNKYATLLREIEAYNAKTKAQKIDTSTLQTSQEQALIAVRNKQAFALEQERLNRELQLWTEYQDLKNKIGEEKAKERFDSELNFALTYEQQLQNAINSFEGRDLTGQEQDQLKVLKKRLEVFSDTKRKQENADYAEALALAQSYSDKVLEIDRKYYKAVEDLGEGATDAQIAQLDKWKKESINALSMEDLQDSGAWADVFVNIMDKTKQQATSSIEVLKNTLKTMLDEGKITIQQYDAALRQIGDVEIKINTSGRGLDNLKEAIRQYKIAKGMAKEDALANLGQSLNNELKKVIDIGNAVGDVFDQLGVGSEKFREDLGMSLDALGSAGSATAKFMAGDILGGIADAITTVSKVINIFSKDRKLEKSIKESQAAVNELDRAFQKLGNTINNSVGEEFYSASREQIKNLEQQRKLIQQMSKDEEKKKKTDQSKVEGYNRDLDSIDEKIKDINRSITEMLVQTSFKELSNSLTDALLSAFEAGEDGIKAMNKTFDKFIKNAIANSLKLKFIEPLVNSMIEKVSEYMVGNNNSLAGFDFETWRQKFDEIGQVFNNSLTELYAGLGLTTEKESQDSLSKGIQGITETTANRLEAEFGGLRIAQLQLLEYTQQYGNSSLTLMQTKLGELRKIEFNTRVTARNTEQLERLITIESSLMQINSKMGNSEAIKRGAGL